MTRDSNMDIGVRGVNIFYVTEKGKELGLKVCEYLQAKEISKISQEALGASWVQKGQIVIIGALGIAVRYVSGLLKDKAKDPGIVVLDECGRYCISLLSGHLGGANRLALRLAHHLNARPVITTSSDLLGLYAPDIWAMDNHLTIEDKPSLTKVTQRLLEQGYICVYLDDVDLPRPDHYIKVKDTRQADLILSFRVNDSFRGLPILRPRVLYVGIGFNTGTKAERIRECMERVFRDNGLSLLSIHSVATVDKKAKDPEFLEFLKTGNLSCKFFTPEELNAVAQERASLKVYESVGAYGVSEPACILLSKGGRLLVPKVRLGDVTIAVATNEVRSKKGRLYVVGTGPGDTRYLVPLARKAILEADVIVGYDKYLRQIGPLIIGKETYSTGMTAEAKRCRRAIEMAIGGKTVALVSGGDPNVYGMAGLVLEVMAREFPLALEDMELSVIPGISALNIGSALLGGALMHDFACISLSDRLTSWDVIEKRLMSTAKADMVLVIYNPRSKGRKELLAKALAIIGRFRSPDTPVGIVKAATRDGQVVKVVRLGAVPVEEVDMETTLIVGNSQSFEWKGMMVTPRGYEL